MVFCADDLECRGGVSPPEGRETRPLLCLYSLFTILYSLFSNFHVIANCRGRRPRRPVSWCGNPFPPAKELRIVTGGGSSYAPYALAMTWFSVILNSQLLTLNSQFSIVHCPLSIVHCTVGCADGLCRQSVCIQTFCLRIIPVIHLTKACVSFAVHRREMQILRLLCPSKVCPQTGEISGLRAVIFWKITCPDGR